MTIKKFSEKQIKDFEFVKAYEEIELRIDMIRASIEGRSIGFDQKMEAMNEKDILVSFTADSLTGILR